MHMLSPPCVQANCYYFYCSKSKYTKPSNELLEQIISAEIITLAQMVNSGSVNVVEHGNMLLQGKAICVQYIIVWLKHA